MKIKLLTRASGPPGSLSGEPGSVHEVEDSEGTALVSAGAAVQLDAADDGETVRAPRSKKVKANGSSSDNTTGGRAGNGSRGARRSKRSGQ